MAVPQVATVFPSWGEGIAALARALNRVIAGEINVVGEVTLTANAATTTVTDQRATPARSIALVQAQSANAAAAIATTYIDPADVTVGAFVIRHANNAQTDRTFTYEIKG